MQTKEEKAKKQRIYYQNNREKELARCKKYDDEHKEEKAKYREEHKEENSNLCKKRYKEKKEWYDLRDRKKRAKKKGVNEHFTAADKRYTMALFKERCFNCGSTEQLELDHHYCLDDGNALTRENAVILCGTCNRRKDTLDPKDFYTRDKFNKVTDILEGTLILR